MRSLALILVNWLIRAFGLSVVAETRRMNGKDAVERGAQWEAFYNEQGGLRDMLEAIRREAFEAAADLDPRETELIRNWAISDHSVRKLQQRIEGVVATGKVEADRIQRIERSNLAVVRR